MNLGVEILSDIIQSPSFPLEEFNKEKKTLLASVKAIQDDIFTVSSKFFRQTFFLNHPYRFLQIGTEESLSNLKKEDIINFYRRVVSPENLVIAISGNINEKETVKIVEKNFLKMRARTKFTPKVNSIQFPYPNGHRQKTIKKHKHINKKQTVIMIGFKGTNIYNPDKYIFEVINGLLNDLGGRLFINLRDKQGLAYSVGSFNISGLDPGAFIFYIVTTKDKKEESIKRLLNEITILRKEKVSLEELNRTKKELLGNHTKRLQTNSDIAFECGLTELYGLGYKYYLGYEDRISKVTQEDILRVAREYFDFEKYVLISVGPEK